MTEDFLKGFAVGAAAVTGLVLVGSLILLMLGPWLRALLAGGRVSLMQILFMRLRGNPPGTIVDAYLVLLHSGKTVPLAEVESQYLVAGSRVVDASELAQRVLDARQESEPK